MKIDQIRTAVNTSVSPTNIVISSPIYLLVTGRDEESQIIGRWLSADTSYAGNEVYTISFLLRQKMKFGQGVETENGYGEAIIVRNFGPLIIAAAGDKSQAKEVVTTIIGWFRSIGALLN